MQDPQMLVSYRQLFGALSKGWFLPPQGEDGLVLSLGSVPTQDNRDPLAGKHARLPVRVSFSAANFQTPTVAALDRRTGEWRKKDAIRDGVQDTSIATGAIPAHAIRSCVVGDERDLISLQGIARQTSNLELTGILLGVDPDIASDLHRQEPPTSWYGPIVPKTFDALAGASGMAYAIDKAMGLDADQHGHFPATHPFPGTDAMFGSLESVDFDNVLWEKAWQVLAEDGKRAGVSSLKDDIADNCAEHTDGMFADKAEGWRKWTTDVLNANALLAPDRGLQSAVTAALAARNPERFVDVLAQDSAWASARSDSGAVPDAHNDAVASSPLRLAARLCGLRWGWSALSKSIKGPMSDWPRVFDDAIGLEYGVRSRLPSHERGKDYSSRGPSR